MSKQIGVTKVQLRSWLNSPTGQSQSEVFVSTRIGPESSTEAVSIPLGWQLVPLYLGSGLLQLREDVMDAVHKLPLQEQLDQLDQSAHTPSIKWDKKLF